jgi:hypothetical protein
VIQNARAAAEFQHFRPKKASNEVNIFLSNGYTPLRDPM